MSVGPTQWEFIGAPFGLSTFPKLFMALMKPLQNVRRANCFTGLHLFGRHHVFGSTEKMVQNHLSLMIDTLDQAEFKINVTKIIFQPVQVVQHLGFVINLAQ